MIRYVVTFPGEVTQSAVREMRAQLEVAENDRSWKDVILAYGGTLTRVNERRVSVRARIAQRAHLR
jgi:hypothetical protein